PGPRLGRGARRAAAHGHPAAGAGGRRDPAPRAGGHLMARRLAALFLLAVPWSCPPAAASGVEGAMRARPVDPATLDAQRGGFAMPSGLRGSFGFERTVHVDGALVLAPRVHVADVGRASTAEAGELAALAQTQLVAIGGAGAVVAEPAGPVVRDPAGGQRTQGRPALEFGSHGRD